MKTLLIVPISKVGTTGQAFGLVDPDHKKVLYQHFCSSSGYAYGDLIGAGREDRLNELTVLYGKYEILEDYRNTDFIRN